MELAAEGGVHEQAGFWAAPWRMLRNLASSILGEDGERDETQDDAGSAKSVAAALTSKDDGA